MTEEQSRLALSTAPLAVSSRASLSILTQKAYVQARTGTNGFSCLVEREFLEMVEPVCYDAADRCGVPGRLPPRAQDSSRH